MNNSPVCSGSKEEHFPREEKVVQKLPTKCSLSPLSFLALLSHSSVSKMCAIDGILNSLQIESHSTDPIPSIVDPSLVILYSEIADYQVLPGVKRLSL